VAPVKGINPLVSPTPAAVALGAGAVLNITMYYHGTTHRGRGHDRVATTQKVFRQLRLAIPEMADQIDWTNCPDVDRDPGKCSGAWCVKGTRGMVQGILDNAGDFIAEQIATEIFEGVPVEVVRRILDVARCA
jgi:uncharacterized protein (DUF433 family)